MNENNGQEVESAEVVTAVGDAWLKTRSKKCGRIYYFNTLTGEAVWNLSDADLKKAKQCHNGGERALPEPPSDNSETMPTIKYENFVVNKITNNTNQQLPMDQYNKPYGSLNNMSGMFPPSMYWPYPPHLLPHLPPHLPPHIPPHLPPHIPPHIPPHLPPHFPPHLPPQHPSQLPSQLPPFLNLPEQNHAVVLVQNTSVPISSRFKVINQMNNEDAPFDKIKVSPEVEPTKPSSSIIQVTPESYQSKIFDLRQVLDARMKTRSETTNLNQSSEAVLDKDPLLSDASQMQDPNEEDKFSTSNNSSYNNPWASNTVDIDMNKNHLEEQQNDTDEEKEDSKSDDIWISTHVRSRGNNSILDLTALRQRCDYNGTDCWFILPDTNVFFNHLNFLNILVISDEQCLLLIVQRVYDEVMAMAKRINSNKMTSSARSACRFIDQLIRSGQAVMDKQLLYDCATLGCQVSDDEILQKCIQLKQRQYTFILLSNDRLLVEKAETASIEAFKIKQLKNFLAYYQGRSNELDCVVPINITIANENLLQRNDFRMRQNQNIGGTCSMLQTAEAQYKTGFQNNHVQSTNKQSQKNIGATGSMLQTEIEKTQIDFQNNHVHPRNQPDHERIGGTGSMLQTSVAQYKTGFQNNHVQSITTPDFNGYIETISSKFQNTTNSEETHSNVKGERDTNGNQQKVKNRSIDGNILSKNKPNHITAEESKSNSKTILLLNNVNLTATPKKKRKIRLNRNTFTKQQAVSKSDSQNSNYSFRWRWKRNTTNSETKFSHENSNDTVSQVNSEISETRPQKSTDKEEHSDSETSTKQHTSHQNITFVPESSSTESDMISNTRSSVHSDTVFTFKPTENNNVTDKGFESTNRNNSKIFNVTDSVMEEMLRMGMEEWVSRFLLIMEEALNAFLLNHQNLLEASMRAPWTVQEAADCIRKCFKKYYRVQLAANCLSNTISNLHANKGNICYNMTPSQYMQMFSHGVYLINILQSDVENSDDIETSKQMLFTLLDDIKHPQTHSTSIESNYDNSKDVQHDKECELPMHSPNSKESLLQNVDSREPTQVGNKEKKIEQTVKFNNNFNNISIETLKKKSRQTKLNSVPKIDKTNKNNTFQPKIIIKFNKCSEFEAKIKRNKHLDQDIDYDKLDYENDQVDGQERYNGDVDNAMDASICTEENDQCYNGTRCEDNDQHFNNCIVMENDDVVETSQNIEKIVKSFLKSIKGTLLQAQDFCVKARSEFCNSDYVSAIRRMELQEQVRDQQNNVTSLLETMKSILDRENNNECKIFITNLRSHIPKSQLSSYRDFIGQVAVQSKILLKALDFVSQILID